MNEYATLPTGFTLDVQPFQAHASEQQLQDFRRLLELSSIAPAVYENTSAGRRYGIQRDWLVRAKDAWLNEFDWRQHETRINSYPNYKTTVEDQDGNLIDLHFLALFSKRADATPVAFFHGWPGSFCEFLDILDLLRAKYTPEELPYHVVVPSLPGYAYSSLPAGVDYGIEQAASALHGLMIGLGFESGSLVQGGDLGSFMARTIALKYAACKGMHVNMMGVPQDEEFDENRMDEKETAVWRRALEFLDTRSAFMLEQGTRPATIGFALSASPLALLAWIGEKILEWSDQEPPLDQILESVTLYWMTNTMSRCFYHNRMLAGGDAEHKTARTSMLTKIQALKLPYVEKLCGYSLFKHEIIPVPLSWAEKSCNLVAFQEHEHGGHFAAMERPAELLADFEAYASKLKSL